MTQLRHDYSEFQKFNTEVLVVVPNGPRMIERHISENNTPYPVLTDKGGKTAAEYFQVKKFFVAGTPTVFVINNSGEICYVNYQNSLIKEPDNQEPLAVLSQLNTL
jgi:peroxiredoxin